MIQFLSAYMLHFLPMILFWGPILLFILSILLGLCMIQYGGQDPANVIDYDFGLINDEDDGSLILTAGIVGLANVVYSLTYIAPLNFWLQASNIKEISTAMSIYGVWTWIILFFIWWHLSFWSPSPAASKSVFLQFFYYTVKTGALIFAIIAWVFLLQKPNISIGYNFVTPFCLICLYFVMLFTFGAFMAVYSILHTTDGPKQNIANGFNCMIISCAAVFVLSFFDCNKINNVRCNIDSILPQVKQAALLDIDDKSYEQMVAKVNTESAGTTIALISNLISQRLSGSASNLPSADLLWYENDADNLNPVEQVLHVNELPKPAHALIMIFIMLMSFLAMIVLTSFTGIYNASIHNFVASMLSLGSFVTILSMVTNLAHPSIESIGTLRDFVHSRYHKLEPEQMQDITVHAPTGKQVARLHVSHTEDGYVLDLGNQIKSNIKVYAIVPQDLIDSDTDQLILHKFDPKHNYFILLYVQDGHVITASGILIANNDIFVSNSIRRDDELSFTLGLLALHSLNIDYSKFVSQYTKVIDSLFGIKLDKVCKISKHEITKIKILVDQLKQVDDKNDVQGLKPALEPVAQPLKPVLTSEPVAVRPSVTLASQAPQPQRQEISPEVLRKAPELGGDGVVIAPEALHSVSDVGNDVMIQEVKDVDGPEADMSVDPEHETEVNTDPNDDNVAPKGLSISQSGN